MHTHFYVIMLSFRTLWTPVRYPDDEMLKEAVWRDKQNIFILVELTVCQKNVANALNSVWITLKSVVCNISILVYARVAELFECPSYDKLEKVLKKVNLHQANILNFVKSCISCQKYFSKFGFEDILEHGQTITRGRFLSTVGLTLTSEKLINE